MKYTLIHSFIHSFIKNLNNLITDESSIDDKYRGPEHFCNCPDIKQNKKMSQCSITMFVPYQKILTRSMHV